jgi:hypothetical protein
MRLASQLCYLLDVLPQDCHLTLFCEFHIRSFIEGCLNCRVFLTQLYERQTLKSNDLRSKQPCLLAAEVLLPAPVGDGIA